jgi:hypothetical protein
MEEQNTKNGMPKQNALAYRFFKTFDILVFLKA